MNREDHKSDLQSARTSRAFPESNTPGEISLID